MKSNQILFFFSLLITPSLYSQATEEAAIKAVIEAETQAFVNKSFAEVARLYWILDEKTLLNVTGPDGSDVQVVAEDIRSQTESPPPNHALVEKTNFRYIINGNMAAATNDQVVTIKESGYKLYSSEVRFMEKVDGQWRIHQSSVHHYEK